ncbi:hypothetical protein J5X84_39395 [Streptosporangiaceae bacterium NEAU-GS5]|nr:hypothetical protein [Streptosporangiaceae bacterium NEAU-GS5]
MTVSRLDQLADLGQIALSHLRALAEREAHLAALAPTGTERFEYALDKITQAMAVEIEALVRRWDQASGSRGGDRHE